MFRDDSKIILMKIKLITLLVMLIFIGCKKTTKKQQIEEGSILTEDEIKDGWVSLFDGKSFNGWHNYLTDTISDEWQIADGVMVYTPHPDRSHGMKNMITDKEYTSFILSLEWNISEAGNSGLFWGIFENEKYPVPYQTAPEIQILDNFNHTDGSNPLKQSGAIFGILGSEKKLMKKSGEWNHYTIEINHKTNKGIIILNGEKVSEFPVHGEEWDKLIANSHFKDWEGFGTYKTGHIGLQDHACKVSFRNIKIKELD